MDARATGTVDESGLTASAANIVQIDCTSASTKMGIAEGHCICWNEFNISVYMPNGAMCNTI